MSDIKILINEKMRPDMFNVPPRRTKLPNRNLDSFVDVVENIKGNAVNKISYIQKRSFNK